MATAFLNAIKVSHSYQYHGLCLTVSLQARRTHYGLSKKSTLSDTQLQKIVEDAVMHVPSPFNIQSARAVLLTGASSDKLWNGVVLPGYLKLLGGDGKSSVLMRKAIKY
jgi:uncharacterized protein